MEYQVTEGILARSVGEHVVLFHPETERLLTLNPWGARIWTLLTLDADALTIISRLAEEFSGEKGVIEQQTLEFLVYLDGEELIRRKS